MKLCEMNTDQMAEALCAISTPVSNICTDENINEELKKLGKDIGDQGMTVLAKMGRTVAIWLPGLLRTHKEDVYKILSVFTGKSEKEIAEQSGVQTMKDVRESLDGEITSFFSLFVNMG